MCLAKKKNNTKFKRHVLTLCAVGAKLVPVQTQLAPLPSEVGITQAEASPESLIVTLQSTQMNCDLL